MRSSPHLFYLVDEENSRCPHLPSYPYIAPSYDSHHVWATKDVELNPQVSKRSNLGLFMYPCLYIEEQLYALLVFSGAGTIDVVTIIYKKKKEEKKEEVDMGYNIVTRTLWPGKGALDLSLSYV